jgi:O-antigen ligase
LPTFVWTYQTVATSNRRTLERYETLKNPLQADSLRKRLDDLWLEAWSDFKTSPVVGHGPGKAFFIWHERFIDSEYLNVLREKGIVGFVVFLAYYLYPLYLIRKG